MEDNSMNPRAWSATNATAVHTAGYVPNYDDSQWEDLDEKLEIPNQPQSPVTNEPPRCAYCLCDIPDCLVQCKATGKWFCNGRGKAAHSHIVHHLVESHNKEVVLPESNPYSKIPLSCYACKTANVFQLGFVQSKRQGTYFVICRDCLNDPQLQPYQFDLQSRQQLITENSILNWIVRPPTKTEEKLFFYHIKLADMNLLEENWIKNPHASILDLPVLKDHDKLPKTQLSYANNRVYCNIYKKLISEEAENERQLKEAMQIHSVKVEWDKVGVYTFIAKFTAPASEAIRLLTIGDELQLSADSFNEKGIVTTIHYNDVVDVKFVHIPDPPARFDTLYTIHFIWKETSYRRQKRALDDFKKNLSASTAPIIRQIILGQLPNSLPPEHNNTPKVLSVPNLPRLNDSQVNAIRYAMNYPFTLIQGPPGTGKTTTIAGLVYNFLQAKREPILVCGPSNISVEHITRNIANIGSIVVVRLMSWSLDSLTSSVDDYTVSHLIYKLDNPDSRRLAELQEARMNGSLNDAESKEYSRIREKLEKRIVSEADVVCCTCDTAGSARLQDLCFTRVIIDESTQTIEPRILIPILHGSRQVILVGDHCQLGPNIMSKKVDEAGLGVSMFQRLVQLGMRPVRLLTQYRMHPTLSEFPSNYFYEGSLLNGTNSRDRIPTRAVFPWPQPTIPMFFYNSQGDEELSDSGSSFINRFEAGLVSQIISKLCHAGVNPRDIGVITPYAGQRYFLKTFLTSAGDLPVEFYSYIEIASVDSFQGGERDYIILSCVRCNTRSSIGFLKDPRRLNVAITRAKRGLIIIGAARVLSRNPLWYSLIKFFQEKQVLVEGDINRNLKVSPLILQEPTRKNQDSQYGIPSNDSGANMVADINVPPTDGYMTDDTSDYFEMR